MGMGEISSYNAALIHKVVDRSEARSWDRAVLEWEITACEEDARMESSCVCGHPDLRYLFTIVNSLNGNQLFPIGSVCIDRFGRQDLAETASIREQMFRLLHALEDGRFITLSTDFFSRKLLRHLFEEGAFRPNEYNEFDGEVDYQFMLQMFNMHNDPSPAQQKKIRAVIVASIIPYLRDALGKPMA
jgi:hypothetical protein